MNYTSQNERIIRTSKELKTKYRPTESERQIRDYCRSHSFSIKIEKESKEPYAVAIKKGCKNG